MEWSDARTWSAVLGCEPAHTDAKIRELLQHSHLVQHAFLRTWRGELMDTPFPTFDELTGIMGWARRFHAEAAAFLPSQTSDGLTRPMPVAWVAMVEQAIGQPPGTTTLGETVLQVALHSIHHRGQISMRVRELGGTPVLVDYIGWLWLGRPAAEWPGVDHSPSGLKD